MDIDEFAGMLDDDDDELLAEINGTSDSQPAAEHLLNTRPPARSRCTESSYQQGRVDDKGKPTIWPSPRSKDPASNKESNHQKRQGISSYKGG